ncbi:MAG: type II secretion system protein [Candidatus Gracilibacteria bacterium]|nr:type II secretion system protein [Candidatus Gracilibacteria bacterium]
MLAKVKNTKGFSLIELLVVIVIIGILSTGAVTYFTSARSKARDAVRQATASQIGQVVMADVLEDGDFDELAATDLYDGTGPSGLLQTEFGEVPTDPADFRYILMGSDDSLDYAVFYWSESNEGPAYVGNSTIGATVFADTDFLTDANATAPDAIAGYSIFVLDPSASTVVEAA